MSPWPRKWNSCLRGENCLFLTATKHPVKQIFPILLAFFFATSPLFSDAGGGVINPRLAEVMHLLSAGEQSKAEAKIAEALKLQPPDPRFVFLDAVCTRSRFEVSAAAKGFRQTMAMAPESTDALAAACVLGVDYSRNPATALYYFNSLLILSKQNPDSIPIHWLAAVMSRALTRSSSARFPADVRKRILTCGILEYEAMLSLMSPGPGPVLIHQTLANLLDDAEGYDASAKHRDIAVKMERKPWSMHAASLTFRSLERQVDALPLIKASVDLEPGNGWYNYCLGDVLWDLGHKSEALKAYAVASKLEPKKVIYFKCRAAKYFIVGDYASARECTRKSLELDPGDRRFQILDARLAALLGEAGAGDRLMKAGSFDFKGNPIAVEQGDSPWAQAIATCDMDQFHKLIGTVDINASYGAFGETPLMAAAAAGWEPIVKELIKAGAKLDIVDSNGDTALHYSADFTQPRMTKLLVDAGANPNIQDKWKQTPLIMCACDNNIDGFRFLMEAKPDLNLATPHGGTPLSYAAGFGRLAMVMELIRCGANVNQAGSNSGEAPLAAACEWAHSYVIPPLLQAGAEIDAQDKQGRTALFRAVIPLMNVPLVELLLAHGADPALADKRGVTPITRARLLGFEDLAKAMEKQAKLEEPFHLPTFSEAVTSLSPDEQKASLFVLPFLLAQGQPLNRPIGIKAANKSSARKELLESFGIENAEGLRARLQELKEFQPQYAGESSDVAPDKFHGALKGAVWKIQAADKMDTSDDAAWSRGQIIYLADLGLSAGILPQDEAGRFIHDAVSVISGRFASWSEFVRSFGFGARAYDGFEAKRYEHICKRILDAALPWPAASVAKLEN